MADTNGMFVNDFHILPGQWRPQCPWEHIAWISPPWPSQYYLWLDLPETVFCGGENFFLSHINDEYPPTFHDLPKVNWTATSTGLTAKRRLPNGVEFDMLIERRDEISVSLQLSILNGSDTAMRGLRTQTCAYLRALKEFSECTQANKYVYAGNWMQLERSGGHCDYRDGALALPVIVTQSSRTNRLIAMSWFENTGPISANQHHPCMHADPCFPDLEPGDRKTIDGLLVFFEGTLSGFEEWFRRESANANPT